MKFSIIKEIPGRARLRLAGPVPEEDLDALIKLAKEIDGVRRVQLYGRIGQMSVDFEALNARTCSMRSAVLTPKDRRCAKPAIPCNSSRARMRCS